MSQRVVEIWVGVFVALGAAALLMLALKVSNLAELSDGEGYELIAKFDNIGGLKVRAPVTMAGVRVGRVLAISYDSEDYVAVVRMSVSPEFDRIPTDTSASIFTAGLLGEQYLGLEPGADEKYLGDQDEIRLTQSAIVLEQVVGQFLYNQAADGEK